MELRAEFMRRVYLADELQREPLQPHVIRRALYEACREVRAKGREEHLLVVEVR